MTSPETTPLDAVRNAWEASLPTIPFEPEVSWRDTGLNSLKTLEFLLRLEQTICRPLGFERMAPDHTPADLVRLLTIQSEADRIRDERRRVFLLPGVFGDEPKLAQFRRALSDAVLFETLGLPDLKAPYRLLANISATAAQLVEEVLHRQPDGDIRLAGYSFGALLAQEMAQQLEAKGRTVAFLAVLDGLLRVAPPQAEPRSLNHRSRDLRLAAQDWRTLRDRAIFFGLRRLGNWDLARRFLLRAARRRDLAWTAERRHAVVGHARVVAMARWRPLVCAAPTLLITSDDFSKMSSLDTWCSICPQARVAAVPGDHGSIFEPPAMAVLAPAFRAALATAADAAA